MNYTLLNSPEPIKLTLLIRRELPQQIKLSAKVTRHLIKYGVSAAMLTASNNFLYFVYVPKIWTHGSCNYCGTLVGETRKPLRILAKKPPVT